MAKKLLFALIALYVLAASTSYSAAEPEVAVLRRGQALVDQLVEEVGNLNALEADSEFETEKELKEAKFAKVVNSILELGKKNNVGLFNLYLDYGKPIADACEKILDDSQSNLRVKEICRFVPTGYDENGYINKHVQVEVIDNNDFIDKIAHTFDITGDLLAEERDASQKEVETEVEAVFMEEFYKSTRADTFEGSVAEAIREGISKVERICSNRARIGLSIMGEFGWPIFDSELSEKLNVIQKTCFFLNTRYLEPKFSGKANEDTLEEETQQIKSKIFV